MKSNLYLTSAAVDPVISVSVKDKNTPQGSRPPPLRLDCISDRLAGVKTNQLRGGCPGAANGLLRSLVPAAAASPQLLERRGGIAGLLGSCLPRNKHISIKVIIAFGT